MFCFVQDVCKKEKPKFINYFEINLFLLESIAHLTENEDDKCMCLYP